MIIAIIVTLAILVHNYSYVFMGSPAYLIDELRQVADVEAHQRLRSSSSSSLIVSRTRLSTIGDRGFPVAAARVWNASHFRTFRSQLKTHLFNISYSSPLWLYSARAVTLSCFGHYNRSSFLTYLLVAILVSWDWYCDITWDVTIVSIVHP